MNFGNYLWGATGYTVNFGYGGLQIGAHLNSRFNSRRNGYTPQWDSKDDQRSIVLGAHHAAKIIIEQRKMKNIFFINLFYLFS